MSDEKEFDPVDIDLSQIPEKENISVEDENQFKLNKTLILSVVFGVFCVGVMLAVFLPSISPKKKKDDKKMDVANSVYIPELIIPQKQQSEQTPFTTENQEQFTDDEVLASIPEFSITPSQTNIAPTRQNTVATGSSSVSNRPDTSGNPIQKNVTGIKGISPTQNTVAQQQQSSQTNNPYAQFGLPTKEDYLKQLSQYTPQTAQNPYTSQNMQDNKQSFFNAGTTNAGNGKFNNQFALFQGTVIPAVLTTGINTDLPGNVIARVTKNVFSSLDGSFVLIPQGSLLFANYNSSLSYGQERVQIAWTNLIRPDGFEISLGNMSGVDQQGFAGYKGQHDEKWFEYVKAAGLVSLFSVITSEMNASIKNTQNANLQNLMIENQSVVNKLGAKLIDRALDIQPTIKIPQGTEILVLTNQTVYLPPIEPYSVTQKYNR